MITYQMKFPLLQGKQTYYPRKALCPQCNEHKVFEPHSMVIFAGGATFSGLKRVKAGSHNQLESFVSITWHGAHDTGIGTDRDIHTCVDLVKDSRGGQFEIYFCSTACLRAFFNSWVDALDAKVQRERQKTRSRKRSRTRS